MSSPSPLRIETYIHTYDTNNMKVNIPQFKLLQFVLSEIEYYTWQFYYTLNWFRGGEVNTLYQLILKEKFIIKEIFSLYNPLMKKVMEYNVLYMELFWTVYFNLFLLYCGGMLTKQ